MNKKIYITLITLILFHLSCTTLKKENIPVEKERLISLVPSITDFICQVNPQLLIGVSTSCDAQCLSDSMPKVGGYAYLDYEKILKLNPSAVCVLKGFTSSEQIKRLNEFNIPIRYFQQQKIKDIINIPTQVDSIKGQELKEQLELKLSRLKKQKITNSPSYLTFISNDPIQVYGSDNYLTELFTIAGFNNSINKTGYPLIQSEYFVNNLPQIIISSDITETKKVLSNKFSGVIAPEELDKILFVEITQNQLMRPNPQIFETAQMLLDKWELYLKN